MISIKRYFFLFFALTLFGWPLSAKDHHPRELAAEKWVGNPYIYRAEFKDNGYQAKIFEKYFGQSVSALKEFGVTVIPTDPLSQGTAQFMAIGGRKAIEELQLTLQGRGFSVDESVFSVREEFRWRVWYTDYKSNYDSFVGRIRNLRWLHQLNKRYRNGIELNDEDKELAVRAMRDMELVFDGVLRLVEADETAFRNRVNKSWLDKMKLSYRQWNRFYTHPLEYSVLKPIEKVARQGYLLLQRNGIGLEEVAQAKLPAVKPRVPQSNKIVFSNSASTNPVNKCRLALERNREVYGTRPFRHR